MAGFAGLPTCQRPDVPDHGGDHDGHRDEWYDDPGSDHDAIVAGFVDPRADPTT